LTQEMGFTNVSRLAGGIIAYDRALQQATNSSNTITSTTGSDNDTSVESMFKGTNYVFDGRVGRKITDDKLGTCLTCSGNTSLLSNCANTNCHRRMVQCETCRQSYVGACSEACKGRVMVMSRDQHSRKVDAEGEHGSGTDSEKERTSGSSNEGKALKSLDDYSEVYSSSAPPLFNAVIENTKRYMPSGSHMVSGEIQGRLLSNLASMSREGRVLEMGTFSGYATMCFLEGAYHASQAAGVADQQSRANGSTTTGTTGLEGGPFVMSLERDTRALQVAAAHLKIASEHGMGEDAANIANDLPESRKFCEMSLFCDGVQYLYCLLLLTDIHSYTLFSAWRSSCV
jgi:hypothetical protein